MFNVQRGATLTQFICRANQYTRALHLAQVRPLSHITTLTQRWVPTSTYYRIIIPNKWPRSISSSSIKLLGERRKGKTPTRSNPDVIRNRRIVEMGRRGDLGGIFKIYKEEGNEFNHVNFATAMSQFGRIHALRQNDRLFLTFLNDLASKLEQRGFKWIGIQGIANIAHAIGKMKLKNDSTIRILQLFSADNIKAEWFVNGAKTQNIANTVWAFATLGIDSPKLFSAVDKRAEWMVKEGNPQAVANTLWAFATLGNKSQNLFSAVDKQAEWMIEEGKPQEVANTIWAFATLGIESPKLFSAADKHAERLVKQSNPQEVANTVWAFATLGIESSNIFSAVNKHAEWLIKKGTPQAVANTVWAFSTLGIECRNLSSEVDTHAEWLVKEGTPQAVVNTALAFATLGYKTANFFNALEILVDKLAVSDKPQIFVNTCYAFVVLGLAKKHERGLVALWNRAMQTNAADFCHEEILQLVQVEEFAKADGVGLKDPPMELRARMNKAMKVKGVSSQYENEVSKVLTQMGFIHEKEVSPLDTRVYGGMLAIDMACKNRKIAIEYDGINHFLKSVETGEVTRIENGATRAKRRFLERSGWKVVNVNYQDWMAASKHSNEEEFLRKKMFQAGVQL